MSSNFSYRDALVRSRSNSSDESSKVSSSEPIATTASTTSSQQQPTSGTTEEDDLSKLSSSPDLDTKEVPLIPSPKPDHFNIETRTATKDDESRESPDSSAGSSFKRLPDSDDASDEKRSSGSDNDFDRGNLNNGDGDSDDDITEGPDTHPDITDTSITEGNSGDDSKTAREERGSNELPDTVTVLEGPNHGKVYLIGTAHFSHESQRDVEEVIRKVQPNVVVLELCQSRLSILSINEEMLLEESGTLTLSKVQDAMKTQGVVQGIMYSLLLSLSAQLTRELGMAPGGEFRRAVAEAKQVPGCIVTLGDRPVDITLRRAISSLSLWHKMKLGLSILFSNDSVTKEEVEKCKQKDLLEQMLAEITGEYPTLSNVFVNERDTYLAYSLQLACCSYHSDIRNDPSTIIPTKVVGVVGIGHVPGIVKNWNNVTDEDIPELMRIPEQSLTTFLFIKTIKYSITGLTLWTLYKLLVPKSFTRIASDTLCDLWNNYALTNINHLRGLTK